MHALGPLGHTLHQAASIHLSFLGVQASNVQILVLCML